MLYEYVCNSIHQMRPLVWAVCVFTETAITQKAVCEIYTDTDRKWQDYVYIQCEYKSTKQKIKHLLREENKVKENKIS